MDCRVESGVRFDFTAAVRAQKSRPVLRVFAAGRFEDGRRYFMVEVCEPDASQPSLSSAAGLPTGQPRARTRRWIGAAVVLGVALALVIGVGLSHRSPPVRTEASVVVQPAVVALESQPPPPRVVVLPPPPLPVVATATADGVPPPPPPRPRRPVRTEHDLEPW